MSILSWLFRPKGKSGKRASYDAAATNKHNSNHWNPATDANADSILYAELASIRRRCRHESRNNPYMAGIARKFANYVVGVGPTMHVLTDRESLNTRIEDAWREWCLVCDFSGEMDFSERLHLGVRELFPAGEFFDIFRDDPQSRGVGLRLQMLEPERCYDPFFDRPLTLSNGVEVDDWGRAVAYWFSKSHPGDTLRPVRAEFERVGRSNLRHCFFRERPEQLRGEPRAAPMLEIFAKLRRFDEATLRAAEVAALVAAFMVTNSDALIGNDPEAEEPAEIELEAGTMMTLPAGYDVKQVTPQHPSSQYEMFKRSKLTDAGAGVDVPYNVLAADSSGHNYASGRLDWQGLVRSVRITRQWLNRHYVHPVFERWYQEARLSVLRGAPAKLKYEFRYPGFEHVDPAKEATAAKTRIENSLQSYADYYAEQGKDWKEEFRQIALEQKEKGGSDEKDETDNPGN